MSRTQRKSDTVNGRALRRHLMLHSAFACLALAITPAVAQEETQQDPQPPIADSVAGQAAAQATVRDQIVITGSRIRRSNLNSAVPVQIFGREDIEEIGSVDVGEILADIPGVAFSLSPETTNTSIQNSGLSTVNLRGLGGNRTLTLIDSRRAVSNSGNGERVSLQTIPSGFVDSIEVTTGGASAIYGSDAIAGVANVILKKDFDGVEANIRYGEADASGEDEFTAEIVAGKNFHDERGNVLFGFTYDKETQVLADSTRPRSLLALEFDDPDNIGDFSDESLLPGCDELDNPAACSRATTPGTSAASGSTINRCCPRTAAPRATPSRPMSTVSTSVPAARSLRK